MSFQRMFADGAPPRSASGSPHGSSNGADPAQAAIAAGVARDGGGGSVVFDPPAGYRSAGAGPSVQRAEEVEPSALEPSQPWSANVEPPAGGLSPAALNPAALSPADLEELAARLFDPLVSRLRAELALDRERAGISTNTWA